MMIFGMGCIVLGCARNVYVPVETVRVVRDSVRAVRASADTLLGRDSVFVGMRGDTVVREVYRWRTRSRTLTDTVVRVRRDTVSVVVPAPPAKEAAGKPGIMTRLLETLKWVCRAAFLLLLLLWATKKRNR